ncbi:unnamed protein product [Merluccius merluccius]
MRTSTQPFSVLQSDKWLTLESGCITNPVPPCSQSFKPKRTVVLPVSGRRTVVLAGSRGGRLDMAGSRGGELWACRGLREEDYGPGGVSGRRTVILAGERLAVIRREERTRGTAQWLPLGEALAHECTSDYIASNRALDKETSEINGYRRFSSRGAAHRSHQDRLYTSPGFRECPKAEALG